MAIRSLIPWKKAQDSLFGQRWPDVDRFFEDMTEKFLDVAPWDRGGEFAPRVNLVENDTHFKLSAELPGMKENEIDISLEDGRLVISGEKREEKETKEKGCLHKEIRYGAFRRDIPLPSEVVTEKVEATYAGGVLTVTLPKTEKAKAEKKKIAIKGK